MFLRMRSRTVVGSWPADRLDFFNHAASAPAAIAAFDLFVETYGVKYERAVAKLVVAKLIKYVSSLFGYKKIEFS